MEKNREEMIRSYNQLKRQIKEYIFEQFDEKKKLILNQIEINLESNQQAYKKFKKYDHTVRKEIAFFEKNIGKNVE